MKQTLENSLHIAKLLYQKGDFPEALAAFAQVESLSFATGNASIALDAIRIQMQCLSEMDQFDKAAELLNKTDLIATEASADSPAWSRLYFIRAFYALQKRDFVTAQENLEKAIPAATYSQDLEYLARALTLDVYFKSMGAMKTWDQAQRSLEKLSVILGSVSLPDIEVWALVMKAHIATENKFYDEASSLLWQAYEKAQTQGHFLLIPGILFQLGRIHSDIGQKTQSQLFFDLCLKGVDPKKHIRQYRLFAQEALCGSPTSQIRYDFVVNTDTRLLQEKTRGYIDFKNQHLLLDLALLFLKNPGQRYSKEDVLETIWNQAYDPSLHDNLIYVSIKRLRTLIEPDVDNPRYILRDRKGYYLNPTCTISFEHQQETNP